MFMQRVPKPRLCVHMCMCNTKYHNSDSKFGLVHHFWLSLYYISSLDCAASYGDQDLLFDLSLISNKPTWTCE